MSAHDEYKMLLASGMFWEFYPELTGVWEKDREQWNRIHRRLVKVRNMQRLSALPS